MDDAATQLADRLLDLRRKAGYSQEQLGICSGFPVRPSRNGRALRVAPRSTTWSSSRKSIV